jgi:hypothetical protein
LTTPLVVSNTSGFAVGSTNDAAPPRGVSDSAPADRGSERVEQPRGASALAGDQLPVPIPAPLSEKDEQHRRRRDWQAAASAWRCNS